jgi:hypothetical protein
MYTSICAALGRSLKSDDVLVLRLDVVDTASHSAATLTVLNAFGQVIRFFMLTLCKNQVISIIRFQSKSSKQDIILP